MATVSALRWPFVARAGQLEELADVVQEGRYDVVHLVGASGVGKTRLAAALLEWAEADGYPVLRVTASRSAASVPLSALTRLLPPDATLADPATLFAQVSAHVREIADGSRLVLMLDDADLLDPTSLALVARLLADGTTVVVSTQREDGTAPDVVAEALRSGHGLRVPVEPLTRASTGTLLHLALGGPLAARAEEELWALSAGNVLFLRELVLAALDSGVLVQQEGVWSLTGPVSPGGGLVELVEERLRGLDDAQRLALELLALCWPVSVDDVVAAAGFSALESLEALGLVEVVADRRRQQARLAHPVYQHVVRERIPTLRARRLLLEQVDRVEARGARRRGDALRLARWRLAATGTADAPLLLEAAQLAKFAHDYPQVERLARAALVLEPHARASTLLGEALFEDGRFEDAETVLAAAWEAAGPDDLALLAVTRALTLHLGLGRLDDALAVLSEAEGAVPPADRASLRAMAGLLLTQAGRSAEAATALAGGEPTDSSMRGVHDRALAWTTLRTGRPGAAAGLAHAQWLGTRGIEDTAQLLHPTGALMVEAMAHLAHGDLAAAEAVAAEGAQSAAAERVEFQAAWLRWVGGHVALARGDVRDARARFTEVLVASDSAGFTSVARLALAGALTAAAQAGDLDAVARLGARLDEASGATDLYASTVAAARAWALAARGQVTAAAAELDAEARLLADRGELVAAADLLHDAVRLGDVAARAALVDVAEGIEGPLAAARVAHARAAGSRSAAEVSAVAEQFATLGRRLVAAELLVEAAGLADDRRTAAACTARAEALLELCPDAATPALRTRAASVALTPREREIALLAASGLSSKDIADRLVLSVRTVDNHLQNVYGKLGVSGRADLATALGPTVTEGRQP